ncbi:hypothetical protein GS4_03_01130 [Gordonia soli NBRC 108243]|uniref:Uncharacterized protein n=1 Tax=Gordonia soli NBRC 108243 TaxID=1223545 RepID=M0QDK9_9ACTN|nr:hypothetical protein GS4_03_01130 [Gordonia soli NBRC 108243]
MICSRKGGVGILIGAVRIDGRVVRVHVTRRWGRRGLAMSAVLACTGQRLLTAGESHQRIGTALSRGAGICGMYSCGHRLETGVEFGGGHEGQIGADAALAGRMAVGRDDDVAVGVGEFSTSADRCGVDAGHHRVHQRAKACGRHGRTIHELLGESRVDELDGLRRAQVSSRHRDEESIEVDSADGEEVPGPPEPVAQRRPGDDQFPSTRGRNAEDGTDFADGALESVRSVLCARIDARVARGSRGHELVDRCCGSGVCLTELGEMVLLAFFVDEAGRLQHPIVGRCADRIAVRQNLDELVGTEMLVGSELRDDRRRGRFGLENSCGGHTSNIHSPTDNFAA